MIVFAGEKPGVYFWKTGQKYNFTGLPFKSTSNFQASFKEGRKDKMQVLTENSNLQWLGTRQLAVRAILPAWFDPFLKKKQEQNKNNCLLAENHIETPYQPCYLIS